ncbi:GAF domain-containing protein [Ascidiimonas sp. W6]|uniref:GAF domain-containing protein n=1 Tax=Ascidiimonas meishanensis TaxID=3128903 RepID=UPI0030EE0E8F
MTILEKTNINPLQMDRLQELKSYRILDTPEEQELDELTQIASYLFETPISLITFIDDKRQWFKSKVGVDIAETPKQISFCQHALNSPHEVLVVDDPLHDERFKDNPFVIDEPSIRFYAGAPLTTSKGNVLGTLCVMDNKPRQFADSKIKALKLLAKKVMGYLEMRKLLMSQSDTIALSASRLKKLSDQVPGAIYQMEISPKGKLHFSFVSEGLTNIHTNLDPDVLKNAPEKILEIIHPDDLPAVKESIQVSFENLSNWNEEYRVIQNDGKISWHASKAKPERLENGNVIWYGTFQDITQRKEYIRVLEKILFDISHVLRKPVATLLGLTDAIEEDNLDQASLKEYIGHIKTVSEEMDAHIINLNKAYYEIQKKIKIN